MEQRSHIFGNIPRKDLNIEKILVLPNGGSRGQALL